MDERRIVWDAANRKHLLEDHPERHISLEEIEQMLTDSARIETYLADRAAYQTIGQTAAGRWLVVAWIVQPGGAYPIHARAASRRLIRRVTQ